MYSWDVLKDNVKEAKILLTITEPCLNPEFPLEQPKITVLGKSEYLFVVLRHGRSCQEMCETILWVSKQDDSTTLQSINSVPWWPSRQRRRIEIRGRIVRGVLSNCSEMRTLGTYWTTWYSMVSEQTCTINTKWTKACDKRVSRLISYIHHTSDYKQYCHVGNTAKQCWLGLFQDSDFAGDSKSTSGGTECIFGSHTFVPISWMCEKQTSVSQSSTESEIISLDAGLRMGRYTSAWLVGSDRYCSSRKYESE